ncbi:hypothetical protein A8990_15529 [Paenibacillus taihuensis]|uniref:Uncharacterized protein n=1 Tax=Paenibacillus taihuensis TaxID=1156355 RepID=A0A3D9Q3Y3_9BACL|nr:hypothetical protein [Paenibacillus taihuensis]REE57451.1 hypothetical protein A8990_15529 [Paenibacillus taihuensis]
MRLLLFAAAIVIICVGVDRYIAHHWIQRTYPANGAVNVPRDALIMVNWKGTRGSHMSMSVRYADAPDVPLYGTGSATMYGLSFLPAPPLSPGKKVIVLVDAGRRHHEFTFTTTRS